MTTERLEEFKVLASILNYSKAASELFISQPILSRHIKELEKETGTTLFIRDTHGVQLTDEGKFFLKWVEPLLEKANHTMAILSDESGGSEGSIRILCAKQTLNTHVLAFLQSFREQYRNIDLKLLPVASIAKKEEIFGADLVLTPCDFTQVILRDVEAAFLCAQEVLLAIPPRHRFGAMQEVTIEDLKGEALIVPYADEIFNPYPRNALLASRKCHGALCRIEADDEEAALLMVEMGAGVMLIPHHLKHRVYAHTRTVPVTDPECSFSVYAYLNCLSENPAATMFFRQMKTSFEER